MNTQFWLQTNLYKNALLLFFVFIWKKILWGPVSEFFKRYSDSNFLTNILTLFFCMHDTNTQIQLFHSREKDWKPWIVPSVLPNSNCNTSSLAKCWNKTEHKEIGLQSIDIRRGISCSRMVFLIPNLRDMF